MNLVKGDMDAKKIIKNVYFSHYGASVKVSLLILFHFQCLLSKTLLLPSPSCGIRGVDAGQARRVISWCHLNTNMTCIKCHIPNLPLMSHVQHSTPKPPK